MELGNNVFDCKKCIFLKLFVFQSKVFFFFCGEELWAIDILHDYMWIDVDRILLSLFLNEM